MVVAVTECRTWKKTSKQHVFADAEGDIKEMLNLTDIRWRTGKVRSAACGTTARFHDHMIKEVNSSDGEWRMSGRKISCTCNAHMRPATLRAGRESGRYLARSTHKWSTLKTDTKKNPFADDCFLRQPTAGVDTIPNKHTLSTRETLPENDMGRRTLSQQIGTSPTWQSSSSSTSWTWPQQRNNQPDK